MSEMSSENNLNTSEVPEKADEDEIEAKAKCPRQQDSNRRCIPLKACKNCGKVWRYEHYCPAEEETCQLCGKIGHWARVCRYLGRYLNTNKSRKYNNDYKKNFRRRNGRKWNRNSRKFDAPNNLNKINNQFGNGRCDNNRSANQSTVIKNGDSKKRANYERERTFSNKNKRNRNNRRNNSWKDGDKDDTDDDKCILNEKNQRKTDKKCADHSEEGNVVNDSSRANFYENNENFDKTESQDEKIFDEEKKEDPKNSEENNLEEKGECDFVESSTRKNTLYSVADDDRLVFDKETKYAYITVGQSRYDPRANDADSHSNENSTKIDEKIPETASGYSDKPENDNDTIGLKRKLANSFYKNGKYEAALSHYSRLIELCPKEPVHFNNRCACYMALGQYKNAFIDAVTVVNLDSSCIKGYCRLIKCAVLLGEITAAELNLSTLSQLDPMNEFVAEERKKLRDLQKCIGKHEFAAKVSNYPDALESINKCLLISPHCLRYKIKKAEYSALLTRYDEAQKLVGEILQEDFNNIEAKYISGICLYAFDANEAMNYLKDLLRLDPDNEKMQKLYRKAKRLSNTMKDGYYLFASMDYSSAHLLYKLTLGLERDHTRIRAGLYQNMGHASYNMGNFQRAIEEYTEAINFDDTNLNALKRRGMSYMRMKEYEEAIADFERVCKLNPGDDSQKFIEDAEKLLASVKKDFYEILGVSRNASIEEIKKAYKDKAILHHPDRHSKATEEQKRKHERKFKDITLAYRDIVERCKRKLSFAGNF